MKSFFAVGERVGSVIHYVEGDYGRDVVFHVSALHLAAHHTAVVCDDAVVEERLFGALHFDDEVPAGVGHAVDVEHDPLLRLRIAEQFCGLVCDADDVFHDVRQERAKE